MKVEFGKNKSHLALNNIVSQNLPFNDKTEFSGPNFVAKNCTKTRSDCFEVNPNFRRYLAMIFEKDNAVIVIESSINSLLVA